MKYATERILERGRSVTRAGWIGLLLLAVVITACTGGGRHSINLMPAPAVFADGEINTLPVGQPPVSYDDFTML